ncbi:MAG: glycoside hydrolase family 3 C-terminal domain-containing protein [Pyrinomonadaceae bacterium]|nr:glycoside hydrolase family 3 C-terminal domain-containing protein [Pyrinomonadaceae bacterium]MBP6211794.1 glycoside hydrolase family 3 C-terminal domain-containing protein [Pyrinomonadaceae bacterium]
MKYLFSSAFVFVLLVGQFAAVAAQPCASVKGNGLWPSKKSYDFADKLLKKMTVEEKVGQLVHVGINAKFANQDSPYFKDLQRHVVDNKLGGIIFFGAPMYETAILGNRMQALAKTPLLLSLDAETGIGMRFEDATNFPWAMAVTATGEPDFARRMGVITGREARSMGIRHVYAPVLDVNNNAGNPVINVRSFGEDPHDVAKFGVPFALGVQSQCVIATAKHFPGHGDTNIDSHRGLPIIDHSRESLEKTELFPFKKAVEVGIGSIMIAHIALPQIDGEEITPLANYRGGDAEAGAEIVTAKATIPATLSEKVQTGILRKDMKFDGLIVSDAMSMSGLTIYFTQEESGVRAFLAGTDILEKPTDPDPMLKGLLAAVKSGRITTERLNESVRRQLAWKHELGLFNDRMANIDSMDRTIAGADSAKLSDEIAAKAITLVRNDEGAIPLDRSKKTVVLGISNGFDGPNTMAAFRSSMSNGRSMAPGTDNGSSGGVSSFYLQENSLPEQFAAARRGVMSADIVVVGMYGRVRSGARNSVGIPEAGAAIIREALAAGKKVIGVSFGNPYILSSFPELRTYVVSYGDMASLQRATARVLLGQQDVTGRLPISLPGLYPRGTGIQLNFVQNK